jgi:hypothetical protein
MADATTPTLESLGLDFYRAYRAQYGANDMQLKELQRLLTQKMKLTREVLEINREASPGKVVAGTERTASGRERPRYDRSRNPKAQEADKKKVAPQQPEAQAAPKAAKQEPKAEPSSQAKSQEAGDAAEDSAVTVLTADERKALRDMSPTEIASTYGKPRLSATLTELGAENIGKSPAAAASQLKTLLYPEGGKK